MTRRQLRLHSSRFWVDVRVAHFHGRWLASADTPDGPSIRLGRLPQEALIEALQPFDGMVEELMEAVPDELYWMR